MYKVPVTKDFDNLPKDWKDMIRVASKDKLDAITSEIARMEICVQEEMKNDGELCRLKEQLKQHVEPYKTRLKMYKTQLKYIYHHHPDRRQ